MIYSNLNEADKRSQIEGKADANFPGVDFANVNMFVEAGAGAGKTTLIVKRIVNQLKKGDEPGSFVVITFTNAAAEELRGRIAEAVKQAGLTNALAHLDEMNISTIHSFCNVLLKEQSILAGLPQSVELMEKAEKKSLQLKYLHAYMAKLTQNDWDAMEAGAKEGETRRAIKQDLQDIYLQIVDLPADTSILTPRQMDATNQILRQLPLILAEIRDTLLSRAQYLLNEKAPANKLIIYNNIDDFKNDSRFSTDKSRIFIEAMDQQDFDAALKVLLVSKRNFFNGSGLTKSYKQKEEVAEGNNRMLKFVEEKIGILQELIPSDYDNSLPILPQLLFNYGKEEHYRVLLEYAKKAKAYYYENRPKNKLSNDNLLEFTRDLICNENDTRAFRFFAGKYKHFYVDEFQDTDRIQEAFIYRLASDPSDATHTKLRDGALFVVGDPKQSIYRFRGAQPQVYFDVKQRMSDPAMTNTYVYELAINFRSNNEIIDWVNEQFRASDSIVSITKNYPYQPMESVKKVFATPANSQKLIHGIYKFRRGDATHFGKVVKKDKGVLHIIPGLIYNEDTVENDMQAVTDLILNLINQHYQITRYNSKQAFAPYADDIHFKDFLLICQDTKKMEMYLDTFKAHGIPVRFDGKATLTQDQVLNTYCRLYWYIVNPKEPFHRMAAKEAIRASNLADDELQLETYADALLDYLYEGARQFSAFGKATYLENQMAALLKKGVNYREEELMAVKARLRQMIEFVLYAADGTGIQLAEAFDAYLQSEVEHELSLEADADAVRFMNVHKSKGLEGEIVILLDRRGHRAQGIESMKDGSSFYPGIKKWSSVSGIQKYVDQDKEEAESEFHRLEYVAVTRAKQAFIFMDVLTNGGLFATSNSVMDEETKKPKKGFLYDIDLLQNSVEPIIASQSHVVSSLQPKNNYDLSLDDADGSTVVGKMTGKPLYVTVNPSKLEKKHSGIKGKVVQENRKQLAETVLDVESGRTALQEQEELFARPANNILGNMLHRTMELLMDRMVCELDLPSNRDEKEIRSLTDFCTRQAFRENMADIPTGENPEEYLHYVEKTAFAYYCWLCDNKMLEGIEAVYTELPFAYYAPEDDFCWMHGTADLIIKYQNGQVCLIDYKSDNDFLADEETMAEAFREKYSPQIAVYRKIIGRMYGTPKDQIRAGILSFSLKDEQGQKLEENQIRVRFTEL